MKVWEIISEARKNPKQNPKISEMDQLKQSLDKNGGRMDNLFVRFTDDNKLGINPQHSYATPFGICAYPFNAVYNPKSSKIQVPFANDKKFMIVFAATDTSRILDLQNISYKTLHDQLSHSINAVLGTAVFNSIFPLKSSPYTGTVRYLWQCISQGFEKTFNSKRTAGLSWAKILKHAGYNMITDAAAVIHHIEPHQTIFLSIHGLKLISVINHRPVYPDPFNPWNEPDQWT